MSGLPRKIKPRKKLYRSYVYQTPRPERDARQSVLIVGCGRIAGGFNELDAAKPLTHVVAYGQAGASVVGCCDRNLDRAKWFAERWLIETYGSDLSTMLRAVKPEVVSICTPPEGRVPIVQAVLAAESVRGLLIEKPAAANAQDAATILSLARRSKCWIGVNYFRAFDPFYQRLTSLCRSEKLGQFCHAVIRYYGPAKVNASHMMERLLEMFGLPTETVKLCGDNEAPVFQLRFEEGCATAIFLPTAGCEYAPLETDLLFSRGRLRIIDSEQRVEEFVSEPDPDFDGFSNLVVRQTELGVPRADGLLPAIQHTLLAARTANVPSMESIERAVTVTEILDKITAGSTYD